MHTVQNNNGAFSQQFKSVEIESPEFESYFEQAPQITESILNDFDGGKLSMLDIAKAGQEIKQIEPLAHHLQQNFKDIVILGTGGSSLGGQTLLALRDRYISENETKLHFINNIDPVTFSNYLEHLDLKQTSFIVISKSGSTAETLTQFLIALKVIKDKLTENAIKNHFLVICEPNPETPISKLAKKYHIPRRDHPTDIGGRFSCFSIVGLLPALIGNLSTQSLLQGAQTVIDHTRSETLSAPFLGAAWNVALSQKRGICNTVMLPYVDKLVPFSEWFCQLWAESLGKQGNGTTPIRALGTVDQHSQLQLYLDGPKDKMFTVITTSPTCDTEPVPSDLAHEIGASYLAGCTMGKLLQAQAQATIETLSRHDCPTRILHIPKLNETTLGALLMHFILETMMAAKLMGVNAFDQPAVEESKRLTREYLKREAAA